MAVIVSLAFRIPQANTDKQPQKNIKKSESNSAFKRRKVSIKK
jgi:hypothetical protein